MKFKHEVTSDFIIEAIKTFFEIKGQNNPFGIDGVSLSLKSELLDFVEQGSKGNKPSSYIFDNYLINEILLQFQAMHRKQ